MQLLKQEIEVQTVFEMTKLTKREGEENNHKTMKFEREGKGDKIV